MGTGRFLCHSRFLATPDIRDSERLSNLDRDAFAFDLFDVVGWNESVFARSFTHMPPIIVGLVQQEKHLVHKKVEKIKR